jgi:hypothetical protein
MNDLYTFVGFDEAHIQYIRAQWDKVDKHFGPIPSEFMEQMQGDAEYTVKKTYKKTTGTDNVKTTTAFKTLCDYLEHLLTYDGIGYT